MKFAKNVNVVDLSQVSLDQLLPWIQAMGYLDELKVREFRFPKTWKPRREGFQYIVEELSNLTKISPIPILPDENVPLYCSQSTRKPIANGGASQTAVGVNSQSLAVLQDYNKQDITGLTKTPSIIPVTMFTEFATSVITFGTLRMIRITIPRRRLENSMNQDQQLSSNLFKDMEGYTKQNDGMP